MPRGVWISTVAYALAMCSGPLVVPIGGLWLCLPLIALHLTAMTVWRTQGSGAVVRAGS